MTNRSDQQTEDAITARVRAAQRSEPAAQPREGGALLARLQRGEPEAAREFYEQYASRVHRFIAHALGPRHTADAEDLMQETFMALADALPFFRGESALLTFACGIAHRKVASYIRRLARRERIASEIGVADTEGAAREGGEDVRRALGGVKAEYRELLILKYVEEMSVGEISAVIKLSEHAVESRLARARRAMKRELGER